MLQIHTIVTPPFAENTYVVWQPPHKQALVIDPGFQPDSILEFLKENELGVAAILNTHGHLDHIAGNAAIKDAYPEAPLMIGALDEPMLTDAELNMSEPLGVPVISPPADRLLREGDIVEAGEIPLEVLEISRPLARTCRVSLSERADDCFRRRRAVSRQCRSHRFPRRKP